MCASSARVAIASDAAGLTSQYYAACRMDDGSTESAVLGVMDEIG